MSSRRASPRCPGTSRCVRRFARAVSKFVLGASNCRALALAGAIGRLSALALGVLGSACDEPEGLARSATTEGGAPLHWAARTVVLQLSPEGAGTALSPEVRDALERAAGIWNAFAALFALLVTIRTTPLRRRGTRKGEP